MKLTKKEVGWLGAILINSRSKILKDHEEAEDIRIKIINEAKYNLAAHACATLKPSSYS